MAETRGIVDPGVEGGPVSSVPGAGVGRDVEPGLLGWPASRDAGGNPAPPLTSGMDRRGGGVPCFRTLSTKRPISCGFHPLGVTVRHPDGHAEVRRHLHELVGLLVAVERVGKVIRAVDEEDRAGDAGQVTGRVEEVRPPPGPGRVPSS